MTSTPRVSNPVSIRLRVCAARAGRGRPRSAQISESATCATTSTWRRLKQRARSRGGRCRPAPARSSAPGTTSGFDACSAGARPKRRPVSSARRGGEGEHAAVERQRRRIDGEGQRQLGGDDRAERPRRQEHAERCRRGSRAAGSRSSAAAPAASAPAPSASRIATSRRRFEARASSRFAMLAQAISRTMPTTIIRIIEMLDERCAALAVGVQSRLE